MFKRILASGKGEGDGGNEETLRQTLMTANFQGNTALANSIEKQLDRLDKRREANRDFDGMRCF